MLTLDWARGGGMGTRRATHLDCNHQHLNCIILDGIQSAIPSRDKHPSVDHVHVRKSDFSGAEHYLWIFGWILCYQLRRKAQRIFRLQSMLRRWRRGEKSLNITTPQKQDVDSKINITDFIKPFDGSRFLPSARLLQLAFDDRSMALRTWQPFACCYETNKRVWNVKEVSK